MVCRNRMCTGPQPRSRPRDADGSCHGTAVASWSWPTRVHVRAPLGVWYLDPPWTCSDDSGSWPQFQSSAWGAAGTTMTTDPPPAAEPAVARPPGAPPGPRTAAVPEGRMPRCARRGASPPWPRPAAMARPTRLSARPTARPCGTVPVQPSTKRCRPAPKGNPSPATPTAFPSSKPARPSTRRSSPASAERPILAGGADPRAHRVGHRHATGSAGPLRAAPRSGGQVRDTNPGAKKRRNWRARRPTRWTCRRRC